jgi:hypothetical protein
MERENKEKVVNEGESRADPLAKKPYERPQIVYRAPLEAMASVCTAPGSKSPTDGACSVQFS